MRSSRARPHPPRNTSLLMRVMARLGAVQVRERFIKGEVPGEIVYGQRLPGKIEINPVPQVVDTIIHEVLHDLYPDRPETTVKAQTTRLFNHLTERELQTIYAVYRERLGGAA